MAGALALCHHHTRVFPLEDLEVGPEQDGGVIPYRPVRFTIPVTVAPPEPDAGYAIHDLDAHRCLHADLVVTRVVAFRLNPHDLYVEGWLPVRRPAPAAPP